MAETRSNILQSLMIFIFIMLFFSISKIVGLYTDFLWFDSLGFSEIFLVGFKTKILLFLASFAISFAFVFLNMWLASKLQKAKLDYKTTLTLTGVLSFLIAIITSSAWMTVLQYLNRVDFGIIDPILGKDAGFYVFSLPFFKAAWLYIFACVLLAELIITIYYLRHVISAFFSPGRVDPNTNMAYKDFSFNTEMKKVKGSAFVHMAILGSLIFMLMAVKHYLDMFSVMYSVKGIVVGAGYTDVYVFLPVVKLLMVLAVVIAVLFYVWIFFFSKDAKQKEAKLKKRHILLYIIILYVAFLLLGQWIIPSVVQSLKVTPNEINLERPFIANNINFTRYAYGLDDVEEKDFDVKQEITPEILKQEKQTIDNIRILDYLPLTQTYKQTQEIRLYYDLSEIDIDRYEINGKYTQVMLAARELDQSQIPKEAMTWVNLHTVYTHGFGVVMSPVNRVTGQGMPDYLIKDIPPIYTFDDKNLTVDQPRIYFGEKDNSYVLVNTKSQEFDYPKGSSNEYFKYDGKDGVVLSSFIRKLAMVVKFGDIKFFLSSDITPETKLLYYRNIKERMAKIAPFLQYDYDPYLVINEGKLYWMQDAYTITGNFPYSQRYNNFNYIRNSVKVVVDAYNGDVTFYVIDKEDPLMKVYSSIYPGEFKDFSEMPDGLKKHIRYPENLFQIQSYIYSTYHMDDVTVFYNKEDAWQIPNEIYGTGQQVKVEPYYIILKLPGEKKEEFVLMMPFTPNNKDNMIAWMAARADGEDYGKLLLFKFPKDKLIYGPSQIEAKIDQDGDISQQLTLWGQQGSRITRGNLLVIPIQGSLLYIEPLFLEAEKGQLPELRRVIASDGEKVVMDVGLEKTLEKLFGKAKVEKKDKTETTVQQGSSGEEANKYYAEMVQAMKDGDWNKFGENFDQLGNVLKDIK